MEHPTRRSPQDEERVRWQEPQIVERGIDQTRMVLEDGWTDSPEFSFWSSVIPAPDPIGGVKPSTTDCRTYAGTVKPVSSCTQATSSIWLARVSTTQKLHRALPRVYRGR